MSEVGHRIPCSSAESFCVCQQTFLHFTDMLLHLRVLPLSFFVKQLLKKWGKQHRQAVKNAQDSKKRRQIVVESKKCSIFAPQKEKSSTQSGCSAVRLAHLLWEQGVPSSNLGTPTKINSGISFATFRGVAQSG